MVYRQDGNQVSIPIGFSIELRLRSHSPCKRPSTMFQSLSGFPLSCDRGKITPSKPLHGWFQSLSGFPLSCDVSEVLPRFFVLEVSIPIGFSIELRHCVEAILEIRDLVFQSLSGFPLSCDSIYGQTHSNSGTMFQSLSGFPLSCDRTGSPAWSTVACFNPYRVFH